MTRDEFLHKYHNYQTKDKYEAITEAKKVNDIGIDDGIAVPVLFPNLGYCLMLLMAALELKKIGLPIEVIL